jgi:hypothetical protein
MRMLFSFLIKKKKNERRGDGNRNSTRGLFDFRRREYKSGARIVRVFDLDPLPFGGRAFLFVLVFFTHASRFFYDRAAGRVSDRRASVSIYCKNDDCFFL